MPAGLWGRPGKIGQIDHALQMHLQYSTVEFIRLREKIQYTYNRLSPSCYDITEKS